MFNEEVIVSLSTFKVLFITLVDVAVNNRMEFITEL